MYMKCSPVFLKPENFIDGNFECLQMYHLNDIVKESV